MTPKPISAVEAGLSGLALRVGLVANPPAPTREAAPRAPIHVVIVTMDTHLASATARARPVLAREFPGLTLALHAASEYAGNDAAIARANADIARADIVVVGMLFMEDHFLPVIEALKARRAQCDAMVCLANTRSCQALYLSGRLRSR